jgi:hypothetical protein
MVEVLNALTFVWLLGWALFAASRLMLGSRHSIIFVIVAHFILTGIPLFLDITVGMPTYYWQPGYYTASRDWHTSVIYCVYVSLCPPFWWWTGRITAPRVANSHLGLPDSWRSVLTPLCYLSLAVPIVMVALAPEPDVYSEYAFFRTATEPDESLVAYHSMVTAACLLSLCAAIYLLLLPGSWSAAKILAILLSFLIAGWLNGKRYFVFCELLCGMYVFWHKGWLRGPRLVAGCIVATILFGFYSYTYQLTYRPSMLEGSNQEASDNLRLDYFRDGVIKMTIYSELYPERGTVLEFRGQSFLFYATFYVPRSVWPDKPYPYAIYMTARLFSVAPRYYGWSVTTSLLEEAIANFGWYGMLIGPLLVTLICRFGDSCASDIAQAMTSVVSCVLLGLQAAAFMPVLILWFFFVVLVKFAGQTEVARGRAPVRYSEDGFRTIPAR